MAPVLGDIDAQAPLALTFPLLGSRRHLPPPWVLLRLLRDIQLLNIPEFTSSPCPYQHQDLPPIKVSQALSFCRSDQSLETLFPPPTANSVPGGPPQCLAARPALEPQSWTGRGHSWTGRGHRWTGREHSWTGSRAGAGSEQGAGVALLTILVLLSLPQPEKPHTMVLLTPSHLAETPSSSALDLFPASQIGNKVAIVPTVPCGFVLLSINIFLLVQDYESWDCLVIFKRDER